MHKKEMFLVLLLALFSIPLSAQFSGKGNYNFFDFQKKDYYFGITLGLNSSNFMPYRSKAYIYSDEINKVESLRGPGFNLGIVTNLKIGHYFDFRFLPTLSFSGKKLNYTWVDKEIPTTSTAINSVLVEMPFHFRYKSAPYKDKRAFVIAGVKYSVDLASDARAKGSESIVKIAPHDFAIKYGAGMQFFFPYFIFSPEIKISHGIGNTLLFNANLEESTVLEKVLSRTITISFHFEG